MRLLFLSYGLFLTLLAGPVLAIEGPTLDLGKTLFEATTLGSGGRSCEACHPAGTGLDQVGDFSDNELKEIINACIRDALKGRMLAIESQEMDALLNYVRMFQK